MHRLLIASGWIASCSLAIGINGLLLNHLNQNTQPTQTPVNVLGSHTPAEYIPALEEIVNAINTQAITQDARPIILAEFLRRYNSPLQPYEYWGTYLTDLADRHEMDYRLLPSIAMQESNLCQKIPQGSFNCLGLGIHSRGTWTFPSFESNFEKAAEILKKNYLDIGLTTPNLIQREYTPSSNGSWEYAVNFFMNKLEYADF